MVSVYAVSIHWIHLALSLGRMQKSLLVINQGSSELSISRVSQTGQNLTLVRQLIVNYAASNVNIWMSLDDALKSPLGGNDA
jgi:hypothetical protein